MDYNALLELVTELGYRLAINGAETFRVEESVLRITAAYGVKAEAFAIPNCLHVSIETADGQALTRMRRINDPQSDLDAVEKYSNLSRRICSEQPAIDIAMQWMQQTAASRRHHHILFSLLGSFLGASGFCILFDGSYIDCIWAGICGLIIGLVNRFMNAHKVNNFFKTMASAFLMALFAYGISRLGWIGNSNAVIIGALMILVPGLLFTNAMRDIIYGDTNSGINRIVQVVLIAAAIALGTGASWTITNSLWGNYGISEYDVIVHPLWSQALACMVGCIGFSFLFNIHGHGRYLCVIGGVLAYVVMYLTAHLFHNSYLAYFWGTVTAALYAEIMARIRKYPAISYLVVSIFPLVPGAGVYHAMEYAVEGDMSGFADAGMQTAAIAGVMAVGILLTSTLVKIITNQKHKMQKKSS